jgi:5-methylcytosine-specific restriction endonuclease McrA
MDGNKTVTATFSEITYTLTMEVTGNGSTTPAVGPHSFACGTVVDISAVADEDWLFVSWTGDVADPNLAETTVTMDSDKTVTAQFASTAPPEDVSHVTHQSNPRGPGLGDDCSQCHNGLPATAGNVDWAACDTCHSPDGAFDGVNDGEIGALVNWAGGVYEADGKRLQSGKELWCATCHDDAPAYSYPTVPEELPEPVVIDNNEATYVGVWPLVEGSPEAYGGDFQYNENEPGSGSDTATWTPNLPEAGDYKVYVWWVANANRATDAPYTITYAGGSVTIDVNQQINGSQWNYLGTYPFAAGTTGSVVLSDDANGYIIADASKFELVDPDKLIMDNGEATYAGDWPSVSGNPQAYGGSFQYNEAGSGGDTATWTPYVYDGGDYRVYARWVAHPNRATDAPYTIHYAGGSETVDVDCTINYGQWYYLGTYPFAAGTTGSVVLSDDADGYVIADAIKLEDATTPPEGAYAPNVVGADTDDDDILDYGFYVTGHKTDCLSCHEARMHHIDHYHRTYNQESNNYQLGYRLRTVGGEPLNIPRPAGDPVANWRDFALCFDCHNRAEVLGDDQYDVDHTNFWDTTTLMNAHYNHLSRSGDDFDSDWDGLADSNISCISCHNVHGSPSPAMIRHGELIATNRDFPSDFAALNFGYVTESSEPDIDPDATLGESVIAGRMDMAGADISENGVCSACHTARWYYRDSYLGAKVLNGKADPDIAFSDGISEVPLLWTLHP